MDPLDSRLWQIEKALELIRKETVETQHILKAIERETSETRRAIEKLLEVVKGGR